jgi:hypothetical protein
MSMIMTHSHSHSRWGTKAIQQRETESYLAIDDLVNGHRSIDITAITGLAARCCSRWRDAGCDIFAEVEFLLTKCIPFLGTLHIFINLQVVNIAAIPRIVLESNTGEVQNACKKLQEEKL